MSRDERARASWEHLKDCRRIASELLPMSLDEDLVSPAVEVSERAREKGRAAGLPDRLVDGNVGAALAGFVVARQHDHPALDVAELIQRVLASADRHCPGVVDVLRFDHAITSATYYRRRTCCLRDRITDLGLHRCDTCSLRDQSELEDMVRVVIERRQRHHDSLPGPGGDEELAAPLRPLTSNPPRA